MSELKKLSAKSTELSKLTAKEGLQFGFGFWFAGALIMLVLIPGIVAIIGVILMFLGVALTGLTP